MQTDLPWVSIQEKLFMYEMHKKVEPATVLGA